MKSRAARRELWVARLLAIQFRTRAGIIWETFARELMRLNSGLIGEERLSRLPPRDRVRAVKAALARRHNGVTRCC